jgi:hypothetical protein
MIRSPDVSPPPACACPQDHGLACERGARLSWRLLACTNVLALVLLSLAHVITGTNATNRPPMAPVAGKPAASYARQSVILLLDSDAQVIGIIPVGATGFEPATPCPPVKGDTPAELAREVP